MESLKQRFKNFMNIEDEVTEEDEYIEISAEKPQSNYYVRSFTLNEFEDIRPVMKALRSGKYVVLVDVKPLKNNDLVDLRRAINKLKSVTSEIAGEIAGLSGDWIIITPHPIKIEKSSPKEKTEEEDELF
jgi:SepF-like predicted cell division protein (DUF552 family)